MNTTTYSFGRPVQNLTEASIIFKDCLVRREFSAMLKDHHVDVRELLNQSLDDGECYSFGIDTDFSLDTFFNSDTQQDLIDEIRTQETDGQLLLGSVLLSLEDADVTVFYLFSNSCSYINEESLLYLLAVGLTIENSNGMIQTSFVPVGGVA